MVKCIGNQTEHKNAHAKRNFTVIAEIPTGKILGNKFYTRKYDTIRMVKLLLAKYR